MSTRIPNAWQNHLGQKKCAHTWVTRPHVMEMECTQCGVTMSYKEFLNLGMTNPRARGINPNTVSTAQTCFHDYSLYPHTSEVVCTKCGHTISFEKFKNRASQKETVTVKDKERLIKRLTEIAGTEYGVLDTEKIEDDIHDLAFALLCILRQDEDVVFRGKHSIEISNGLVARCVLCQQAWSLRIRGQDVEDLRNEECPGAQI